MLVIVQARTSSTRLPGKVLRPLAGRPLLERMLQRIQAASSTFDLVVATTTDPRDDSIVDLATRMDVPTFRGHPPICWTVTCKPLDGDGPTWW